MMADPRAQGSRNTETNLSTEQGRFNEFYWKVEKEVAREKTKAKLGQGKYLDVYFKRLACGVYAQGSPQAVRFLSS